VALSRDATLLLPITVNSPRDDDVSGWTVHPKIWELFTPEMRTTFAELRQTAKANIVAQRQATKDYNVSVLASASASPDCDSVSLPTSSSTILQDKCVATPSVEIQEHVAAPPCFDSTDHGPEPPVEPHPQIGSSSVEELCEPKLLSYPVNHSKKKKRRKRQSHRCMQALVSGEVSAFHGADEPNVEDILCSGELHSKEQWSTA
jgi:hypothetical protein